VKQSLLLLFALISQTVLANKAIINSDLVLVIDGKKVFPIGFTLPPPPDGKTPTGKNGIAELASAGATFLRTGGQWNAATLEREHKYMDAAARYGMHCLPFLRENAIVNSPQREAQLRQLITRFKDHPGLGAWKGADEPEWGKQPIEPLLRGYKLIKEVDPNHPLVLIQAPRGTVESLRKYNVTADIIGVDIYPVSYPPGIHSLETNFHKGPGLVGDYTRLMAEVGEGRMPVWMVLQISWSGVLKPGKTLRMPTFAEERFMTYQAIINGARGLIYFGGNNEGAMSERDKKLGWNWQFWDRALRPVIEEIGSKGPVYAALLAPDSKVAIKAGRASSPRPSPPKEEREKAREADEKGNELNQLNGTNGAHGTNGTYRAIEFSVREVGNELFILACKGEGATEKVEFSGLPGGAGKGDVLYEEPRTVQAKQGKFTDWFGPYEVHVYRFSR